MRVLRLLAVLLTGSGLAIAGSAPASAAPAPTPVDLAAAALQRGDTIYVEPDAPGAVDARPLQVQIASRNTPVVLAVLSPATVQAAGGGLAVATRLSTVVAPRAVTAGVLSGRDFTAASTDLDPATTARLAADALGPPTGIGPDAATVLSAFVRGVADQRPVPVPDAGDTGGASRAGSPSGTSGIYVVVLGLLGAALVFAVMRRRLRRRLSQDSRRALAEAAGFRALAAEWLRAAGSAQPRATAHAQEQLSRSEQAGGKRSAAGAAASRRHAITAAHAARLAAGRTDELPDPTGDRGFGRVDTRFDDAGPDYRPDTPHWFGGGLVDAAEIPAGWFAEPVEDRAVIPSPANAARGFRPDEPSSSR